MKYFALLLLFAMPVAAQTLEQRADNIIADANQAENAMQRVMVETKRLKADIAAGQLVATPAVVVGPAIIAAPVGAAPTSHQHSMLPFIDVARIPAPSVGYADRRIRAERELPKQNLDGTGQFRIVCKFSHMNFDDPIVYPGQPKKSHLHAYFGLTTANYATTAESITKSGGSTCSGGTANRTGYWVPAIIDTKDGTPLKPDSMIIYYKTGNIEGDNVQPFPAGLRMIAGDMRSTVAQDYTDWGCLAPNGDEQRYKSIPANCPAGYIIEATIEFPFCWNGVDLDSPDHKSHMAYAGWDNNKRKTVCPKTHPVELPMIAEKIKYRVTEAGSTARWRLASDNYSSNRPGGLSTHADWFNGWESKVQEAWVKNCLQANRDCHADLLGDGTVLY